MARLIDAKKLNAVLQNQAEHLTENGDAVLAACLIVCQETVERQPTIEATPVVHGRWENVHDGWGRCSNCHRMDEIHEIATNCRFCGARMDGDGDA